MSLADEVRTVRQRVAARLRELEPLVREYEELRMLATELGIEVPERGGASGGGGSGSGGSGSRGGASGDRASAGRGTGNLVAVDQPEAGSGLTTDLPGATSVPSEATTASAGSRRRRSGSGQAGEGGRDARVLGALRSNPGATTAELATLLGVPATSLYRPVRELTSSGTVVKRGRGLYLAES